MLLGTLGDILLGNLLTSKGAIATSQGWCTIRVGKGLTGKEKIATGQGWCTIKANKGELELVKEQLELTRIFNSTSSFEKFWNTNFEILMRLKK